MLRRSAVCMVQVTSNAGSRRRYLRMRRILRALQGQLPLQLARVVMLSTCYVIGLRVCLLSLSMLSTLIVTFILIITMLPLLEMPHLWRDGSQGGLMRSWGGAGAPRWRLCGATLPRLRRGNGAETISGSCSVGTGGPSAWRPLLWSRQPLQWARTSGDASSRSSRSSPASARSSGSPTSALCSASRPAMGAHVQVTRRPLVRYRQPVLQMGLS